MIKGEIPPILLLLASLSLAVWGGQRIVTRIASLEETIVDLQRRVKVCGIMDEMGFDRVRILEHDAAANGLEEWRSWGAWCAEHCDD